MLQLTYDAGFELIAVTSVSDQYLKNDGFSN